MLGWTGREPKELVKTCRNNRGFNGIHFPIPHPARVYLEYSEAWQQQCGAELAGSAGASTSLLQCLLRLVSGVHSFAASHPGTEFPSNVFTLALIISFHDIGCFRMIGHSLYFFSSYEVSGGL